MHYYFEVTDTFGGEANYCWAHRYIVNAPSFTAALRKVNKVEKWPKLYRTFDSNDEVWWKPRGCNVILMARIPDDMELNQLRTFVKEIS